MTTTSHSWVINDRTFRRSAEAHVHLGRLCCVYEGRAPSLDAISAAVHSLFYGAMCDAVVVAHEAFESGRETEAHEEMAVTHAFEARLLLRHALFLAQDGSADVHWLYLMLEQSDEHLATCDSATLLIDERDYDRIVDDVYTLTPSARGQWPGAAHWWSARERLDRSVPAWLVDEALDQAKPAIRS